MTASAERMSYARGPMHALITAALVAAGAAACTPGDNVRPPQKHVVEMRDMRFDPSDLTVAPGDTITWINHDIVPHTATSVAGNWDSGEITAGSEYRMIIGDDDTGDYRCAFHPAMQARVTAG